MYKEKNLIQYLPAFWNQIEDMRVIQEVLDLVADEMQNKIDDSLNQSFIMTATTGLTKWEKELGIETNLSLSYRQRRESIIAKLRGAGTTTLTMIRNVAQAFVNGEVEATEENSIYTVKIKFIGTKGIPDNLDGLKKALRDIIPAHLAVVYIFTYLTWDEFDKYNKTWDQWDNLDLTWNELEKYKEAI